MDPIYLIIVVILLGFAVLDLTVGVANDAVNFLNSSIGSKVAPLWVILTVASVGVMLGTLFSSGMMEIARSGVFHPEMFTFPNIMVLFLAVMLTDVILLDVFNSLGLPTSTTVSLVFELLGAAVAVALFSIWQANGGDLVQYINSGKALAIISGIFISIAIAFVVGSLVMFVTRTIFSFKYKKSFQYLGAIWCGFALTAMTYFIVFKGLRGSPFMVTGFLEMVEADMAKSLLITFAGWTVIMALFQFAFRINILKIIVLAGTMALALAFASNDLVNFIGVPLAGLDAYKSASAAAATGVSIDTLFMGALGGPVKADIKLLLLAGLVMVAALWFSKKAKSVTETEVNLGRQGTGLERFSSTPLSRSIVRWGVDTNKAVNKLVTASMRNKINSRFVLPEEDDSSTGVSFDLIRASVNLTIAAMLISLGTSLKLPLSTTYVTFMVAMGTSLADRAWGRESAVYRITGVLTVIGGWFITAIVAFTVAGVVATILAWGGKVAVFVMVALVIFLLYKSSKFHKKRKSAEAAHALILADESGVVQTSTTEVRESIKSMLDIYHKNIKGIKDENRSLLRKSALRADILYRKYKDKRTYEVVPTIQSISLKELDIEQEYVQIVDYTYEITKALRVITSDSLLYIENNHKGFNDEQEADLEELSKNVVKLYETFIQIMDKKDYSRFTEVTTLRDFILEMCARLTKKQIKRVKARENSTRNSILFMNILNETKNIALQSVNLMKSQRNMIQTVRKNTEEAKLPKSTL
ncbi:MAG: inorganic phosphate transporter [Bacteroidia bacterium]|nr:inorganic phosphate transporter [Bacteroidia bacterium]